MTDIEKGSLIILCAVIAVVVVILIILLIISKKKEEEENLPGAHATQMTKTGMPFDDIKNFLPFDEIKDDMIIQEKGDRFTMLVECDGINYYLMSEAERVSVEEGFIQFLNSLRFPIQIYVQTRTVNLDDSINAYKERLGKMQDEFNRLLETFKTLDKQGAPEEKLLELGYQLEKKEKVLDYTSDLVSNVSYLTQNRNVLQKKYYIVVSYHVSEMGLINNFDKNETYRIAREELTNRADSVIGAISSCGIESRILDTFGLTEAMYIAVNRDGSDIFNIKKLIDSDIYALSSTAENTVSKKKELAREEKRKQKALAEAEAQKAEYEKYQQQQQVQQEEVQPQVEPVEEYRPTHKSGKVDSSTML